MTSRSRFDAVDAGLFGLGVLGVVLFVWLLPSQHSDSTASYAFGREAAVEEARTFLAQQGYDTAALTPRARLMRATRLLDSLQASLGRPEAVRVLRAGGDEELPAAYWNVQWRGDGPASPFRFDGRPPGQIEFEVDLTQTGAVWQLGNAGAVLPRAGVDREVLRALLEAEPEMGEMLTAPPDSALGSLLYFDFARALQPAAALPPMQADWDRLHAAAMTGLPQGLSAAAAAAIAREHLATTSLAALPFAVASVEALPERGRSAARVRFETTERVWGQRVAVDADVTAAGALLALDVSFNGERQAQVVVLDEDGLVTEEEANDTVSISLISNTGLRAGVRWVGYVALMLMLLVVMFRQFAARSLDGRAAVKDALLTGVTVAASYFLVAPMWAGEMGTGWSLWVFVAFGMLFGGAGFGLLVFVASAASDALARAAWPRQIETLSLARQGAFVNQPVGRALVRGAALGGVLLGVQVLGLVAVPSGRLVPEVPLFGPEASYFVFGAALTSCLWYALLLVLAVYVGLGSILRRWHAGAVVPGLALALGVLGFAALDLPVGPAWLLWGAPVAVGVILAWAYVRYDALTIIAAVLVTGVLWDTAEGWLVAASPALVDAVLGFAFAAGVVALGLVGVRSDRTGETLPSYEPDYVAEQRERGRLQRELEIAREVQRSFLPVNLPQIAGLDLAARCLAAEEVGGDYYDVIPLADGRLALVIGDVSGKGIQAAFFMTLAKGFLQSLAHETDSPAEVLRRANRLFVANAPRGTFISLIYGVFDLDARTFTFARAGHNPVILKRSKPGGPTSSSPPASRLA